jgi:hypothetical protein
VWQDMQVFVLLFNARTENEGIHTIRVKDPDQGEIDLILMFEVEEDATRFAVLLEAQDFPEATVEAFDTEEIEEFCQSAGYECLLLPEGTLAMPPETNIEQTDWRPEGSSEPDEMTESELDRIRRRLEGLL